MTIGDSSVFLLLLVISAAPRRTPCKQQTGFKGFRRQQKKKKGNIRQAKESECCSPQGSAENERGNSGDQ